MGKEEFLRELGVMLNDASEEMPRAKGGYQEGNHEAASKADSGISVTKRLSNLEKEFRVLKQQMETITTGMSSSGLGP